MGHILNSPFQVPVSKKKNFSLNLNIYRGAHYQTLNRAKIAYKELMSVPIATLPVFNKITLKLVMYPQTKRLFDIGNVGSVTEKFFLDALVEFGKLEDDNYLFVPEVIYQFGSIDKLNPRIEVHIDEFKI